MSDAIENTDNLTDDVAVPENEPPKKRGPGRPRKVPELLETETVTEDEAKPKPKAAARPRRTAKAKENEMLELANQLVGVHAMVAMVTGIPEAQIDPKEGEALAKGITAVCEQYNLSIDGKTGAALQLAAACAMIYGPRAMMYAQRVRQQQKELPLPDQK